tara:strand:+ start:69 stop:467 length:399 start_codon:yes stop_codon:yes gene_type:complete
MKLNLSLQKSDAVGVISSGLCMIHCLATPVFFIAATCSTSCCNAAPLWWQWIDYAFLIISFIAITHSIKSTNSNLVKYGLWVSWVALFLFILNIQFQWFSISDNIKFIPAFSLIGFHLYNIKYCKCSKDECC